MEFFYIPLLTNAALCVFMIEHDSKLTGNNLDAPPDQFAGKVCLGWLFIGRSLQAERAEREQAISSNHAAGQIA